MPHPDFTHSIQQNINIINFIVYIGRGAFATLPDTFLLNPENAPHSAKGAVGCVVTHQVVAGNGGITAGFRQDHVVGRIGQDAVLLTAPDTQGIVSDRLRSNRA